MKIFDKIGRWIGRWLLKLVGAALLAAGFFYIAIYAGFYQLYTNQNYYGAYLYNALRFAFEGDEHYPESQVYKHLIPKELLQKCDTFNAYPRDENQKLLDPGECWLVGLPNHELSDHMLINRFAPHCGIPFFSRCNGVELNPVFLKHPAMLEAARDVINNPCKYYPSDAVLDKLIKAHSQKYDHERIIDAQVLRNHSKAKLSCGKALEKTEQLRIIVMFAGDTHGGFTEEHVVTIPPYERFISK